ncbi:alpha/beta hydrolase [Leptothermofonsia sp. ETS-13]|uniref:alpha/beta hydrolase n=1 Tax=Leptothermofonsia sp. ETS-13 TaxID=3035696 RepID=UPI003B9EC83E
MFESTPISSAEKLYIRIGPLKLSLSLDSLETFAETGEIDRELRFYAQFAGDEAMAQLRRALRRRFQLNPVVVSRLSYSPLGEDAISQLGEFIQTEARINGFYAMRSSWILAATDPEGFTLIDLMRRFPTQGILLDAERLLAIQRLLTAVSDYTDTTVAAIAQNAQNEAATVPVVINPRLPDPRLPGPFKVTRRTLQLARKTQTIEKAATLRSFYVDLYLPEGKSQPAPVAIISHGLGSTPAGFAYLGRHLASHGFVAALPEHIGSSAQQREDLFQGLSGSNVTLTEFIERPLDVKQTLDKLEQLSQAELAGKLDVQKVGIIGHSFGGYTALVTAGATFNLARLFRMCSTALRFNSSVSLQCLNTELPYFDVSLLKEPRIKAAIAMSPFTSLVFGPEGMGTIQVPTMILGGSRDIVTPFVLEQVHPFLWLKTKEKYLVNIHLAGHTAMDGTGGDVNPEPGTISILLSGPEPTLAREYVKALNLVFMQVYVGDRPEYRAYLNAAYALSIARPPLQLHLVNSLTPEQLETAHGGSPPIPIFPDPIPNAAVERYTQRN